MSQLSQATTLRVTIILSQGVIVALALREGGFYGYSTACMAMLVASLTIGGYVLSRQTSRDDRAILDELNRAIRESHDYDADAVRSRLAEAINAATRSVQAGR